MATFTTERLLEDARNGTKLDVDDRRRCIRYLMIVNPENSNVDLSGLFQISEAMIRKDKIAIRQEIADDLRKDDVGLVIADIEFNFRRQLRGLETSKAKCALGTTEYRLHCQAILDIELRKTKMFQDLGYLPKNLGNLTTENYEYAAVLIKDGSVESRPMNLFDAETQQQIKDRNKPKALPQPVVIEGVAEVATRTVSYAAQNPEEPSPASGQAATGEPTQ
jgi:hypothetical protein